MFRDEQVSGPFSQWVHTHRFIPDGANASWLEDRIEYKLQLSPYVGSGHDWPSQPNGSLYSTRSSSSILDSPSGIKLCVCTQREKGARDLLVTEHAARLAGRMHRNPLSAKRAFFNGKRHARPT